MYIYIESKQGDMTTILTSLIIGLVFVSMITIVPNVNATLDYSHTHPLPILSISENKTIINTALAVAGLQNWSHDWQYAGMAFLGNNKPDPYFQWQYASVTLRAPSSSAPVSCDIDWRAHILVDMTTMKVISADYPTTESHLCHGVELGGATSSSNQNSNSTETYYIPQKIESPLKQMHSGTLANNVICNEGLQLLFKREDGSPACVTSNTAEILVERGWARSS